MRRASFDVPIFSVPDHSVLTPKKQRFSYDTLFEKYIELQMEVEQLEERLSQAEQQIERLSRQVRSQASSSSAPRKKAAGRRKKRSEWVPFGYTPCVDVAREHNIPVSTMRSAVAAGDLTAQTGNWKWADRTIHEMFDEDGEAQFYTLFHTHPRFERCPYCPH